VGLKDVNPPKIGCSDLYLFPSKVEMDIGESMLQQVEDINLGFTQVIRQLLKILT
jgi:hypothetical protein